MKFARLFKIFGRYGSNTLKTLTVRNFLCVDGIYSVSPVVTTPNF